MLEQFAQLCQGTGTLAIALAGVAVIIGARAFAGKLIVFAVVTIALPYLISTIPPLVLLVAAFVAFLCLVKMVVSLRGGRR